MKNMKSLFGFYLCLVFSVANVIANDTLDEVVVTSKSALSSIDTAGSYSIINAQEIATSGATTILEVLSGQPGVTISGSARVSSSEKVISIRGAYGKHTLVLINGKRVNGSDGLIQHSSFKINWLPLDAIEKIEIIRGPMSVLYGSDAIGGVVNIITKKSYNDEQNIDYTLALSYGQDNASQADKSINIGALGNLSSDLSFSLFFGHKNNALREYAPYTVEKKWISG